MNQKVFIQKSDEIMESMSMEELKSCLHNIARKTSESKREEFLQQLQDCRCQNSQRDTTKKSQYKRLISDEKVKEKLNEIKSGITKIQNGELCISAQGYEDYSNGYWASDWIWEYEDNEGVGRLIEDAILFAHDCMNDCRYEEAVNIFELVMNLQVFVEDECGGDSFELSFEEMVDEKLVGINLKVLALDVLYSNYQLQTANKRANILYSYFAYGYFKDIHIEDIFSIGREELRDTDMFLQSWIDFLMTQSWEIAARLLRESLIYYKGTEGLVEMARQGYKEHPSVYLAALLEYEKSHDYIKIEEVGKEALNKLPLDLKIRGEIALKTAQASYCINDYEFMKKCWYEAFYSNSTVLNYLRLFVDKDTMKEYKDIAEKRIGKLRICDNYYRNEASEMTENVVSKFDYKYLCFFSGKFNEVQNWCNEQKRPLGWSGSFIGDGLDLMLLYLYADVKLRKACKNLAARVSSRIGFNELKNLVFIKENYIFETEVGATKYDEIFLNIFSLWKINYVISADDVKRYVEWLEAVIDKRIDGIVGGKYRNKYNAVALLAAALGEVKESLGVNMAKSTIISKYMGKYSRHTAFRGALREYLD